MALVESRVKHVTSSALSLSPHGALSCLAKGEGETARQRLISNYVIHPRESLDLLPNDTGCNRPPTMIACFLINSGGTRHLRRSQALVVPHIVRPAPTRISGAQLCTMERGSRILAEETGHHQPLKWAS